VGGTETGGKRGRGSGKSIAVIAVAPPKRLWSYRNAIYS
jgi:hypothetical protein